MEASSIKVNWCGIITDTQKNNNPKGKMLQILKDIHESTFKGQFARLKTNSRESDSVYAMRVYCPLKINWKQLLRSFLSE